MDLYACRYCYLHPSDVHDSFYAHDVHDVKSSSLNKKHCYKCSLWDQDINPDSMMTKPKVKRISKKYLMISCRVKPDDNIYKEATSGASLVRRIKL